MVQNEIITLRCGFWRTPVLPLLRNIARCVGIIFLAVWLIPPAASGQVTDELITNGGYLVVSSRGSLEYHASESFVPASTLKILTCLQALEKLGPGFRFTTDFFLDQKGNLYIKGNGDPLLTSEVVRHIAQRLKQLGLQGIQNLYLDDSSFYLTPQPWQENSDNPYDAPNSALAVNFNSVPVRLTETGGIDSGELETPTLPIVKEMAQLLTKPGTYRKNVGILATDKELPPHLRYVGELFSAMFSESDIGIKGVIEPAQVPASVPLFYHFLNPASLEHAVRSCLKFSNNFIANQLFLLTAMTEKEGDRATWESARKSLVNFTARQIHLEKEDVAIIEGSGLSKGNRLSPKILCKILLYFRPYAELLPRHQDILLKSGTLDKVFCYAGYFVLKRQLIPFCILLNQPRNTRDILLEQLKSLTVSMHSSH